MMTHLDTVAASATSDTAASPEPEILYLDPDTAALFAEVDAILCAAPAFARQPPAPPVTGCALVRPRSAGRPCGYRMRPRRAPTQPVRAVERGPPTPEQPATNPQRAR
jgi:hypothetical protein